MSIKIPRKEDKLLQIVIKVKKSCTAYEKSDRYIGRGRPRKKGKSIGVKLSLGKQSGTKFIIYLDKYNLQL